MRILQLILLAGIITSASAQLDDFEINWNDPGDEYREHQLDIRNMKVAVRFEPKEGKVHGKVTHTFSPIRSKVDSVFWDGIDIQIQSAKLDGKNIQHRSVPGGVMTYFNPPLTWDRTYTVSFDYTATPQRGIYFIGWNVDSITDPRNQTRKQIWTQGQGIDNRHWIPMYDNMNDKFTTETITTIDSKYQVLSNGQLLDKSENKDGTTTWHYALKKPHAGYLLMLGIGEYAVQKTETKRGTPVQFWYYPEHPEKLKWSAMHTEQIIEFLEDETGVPYPWGSYSQVMVQDFIYGAMENTSATIFGDFFNVDANSFNDRNYIGVNAHELTHQWFGDLITARTSSDIWLQESFATYYAKLFDLHLYGEDEFKWKQYQEMQSALAAGEKNNLPVRHSRAGSSRHYPKGSLVIQMLRRHVGDEAFKRVIQHYLTKHAHQNVETNNFKQAFEDVLGINIEPFFDQWVWRGDEPHFDISTQTLNEHTLYNIEQVQPISPLRPVFEVKLNLEVHYQDGSVTDIPVRITRKNQQVVIPTGSKTIDFIVFDSNNEILKEVNYHRTPKSWMSQALKANHAIDRFLAVKELQATPIDVKRITLQKILTNKDEFVQVRSEAARQLANDNGSMDILISSFKDEDVLLRRAYLKSVNEVTPEHLPFFKKALEDHSYINIILAIKKITASSVISKTDKLESLSRIAEVRGQNQNVRIAYLKERYLLTGEGLDELTSYLSDLYEFRTRLSAMRAIKEVGAFNPLIVRHLLKAGVSNNRRLGNPAVSMLSNYAESRTNARVISEELAGLNLTDQQKSKLGGLLKQLP
jgi:aminopeptidase N